MLVRVLYTRLDANPEGFTYSRGGILYDKLFLRHRESFGFARTYVVASMQTMTAFVHLHGEIRTYLRGASFQSQMHPRCP